MMTQAVDDLDPETAMALTLYGIWSLSSFAYDEALYLSHSLNIALSARPAGYRVEGRMISLNQEANGPRSRARGAAAEDDGFHAPLVRKGSKLRLSPARSSTNMRHSIRRASSTCSTSGPRKWPIPTSNAKLRRCALGSGPWPPEGRAGDECRGRRPAQRAVAARRLIATWPYSYLLCDEIGLGKTIEAGLATRSLYLSGLVQRILICAPASLTLQWQREMASKFLLPFGRTLGEAPARHAYLYPGAEERSAGSVYAPDLVIVSTGLMERRERRADLDRMPAVDIAHVEKTHYAHRKNPTAGSQAPPEYGYFYLAIEEALRPKAWSLWLATATPMQLDAVEAADLLALTRCVGALQHDPCLMQAYYETLSGLTSNRPLRTPEWAFLQRAVLAVEGEDPSFWSFLQQTVIDGRTRLAVRQWLDQGRPPRSADLSGVRRLIFAASPVSRVILRHTRPLLEIYRQQGRLQDNLARRHIRPIPRIVFTQQERQA
jgi:hypothetical protein